MRNECARKEGIMQFDWNKPLNKLVIGGLLAALILLLTIVVAIPIPQMAGAYVNLGDIGVYLAAYLLGGPWGALCAAVGSSLADVLLGSMLYAGPTFLIKGLMALCAGVLLKRLTGKRFVALLIGGIIMPLGYFLFESVLYGADVALLGVPANLAQYAVGVGVGMPVIRLAQNLLTKKA